MKTKYKGFKIKFDEYNEQWKCDKLGISKDKLGEAKSEIDNSIILSKSFALHDKKLRRIRRQEMMESIKKDWFVVLVVFFVAGFIVLLKQFVLHKLYGWTGIWWGD